MATEIPVTEKGTRFASWSSDEDPMQLFKTIIDNGGIIPFVDDLLTGSGEKGRKKYGYITHYTGDGRAAVFKGVGIVVNTSKAPVTKSVPGPIYYSRDLMTPGTIQKLAFFDKDYRHEYFPDPKHAAAEGGYRRRRKSTKRKNKKSKKSRRSRR